MSKPITGQDLGAKVAQALGIKRPRRIILDMSMDAVCLVYIEMIGDNRLYEVDFNGVNYEIKEEENDKMCGACRGDEDGPCYGESCP